VVDLKGFLVNSYAYTVTVDATAFLRTYAKTGAEGAELMVYPGHLWPTDIDADARTALRRLAEDAGFPIVTVNMPNVDINVAAAAPGMRAYSLSQLEAVVDLAGDLGARGVVIGPGKPNPLLPAPREQMIGWFFKALDRLLPAATAAGTELWVENMPFAFLPDADGMMIVLDNYGADEVGIVYDIANAHFIAEDLRAGLERVGPRLKLVHVSDTTRARYLHAPIGNGDLNLDEAVEAYARAGRDVPVVLEIISGTPDADIPASAQRLREANWPDGGPAG